MYVIDFDDTIFDSNGFTDFFIDVFTNTGRNKIMLLEMMEKSKDLNEGIFDFKKWLDLCGIKEREFDIIRSRCPDFVYPDFIDFAQKAKEKIVVLSYGDKYFQEKKILKSGAKKNIYGFFITQKKDKKEDLIKIHKKYKEKITYIDNKVFVKKADFGFDIDILKIVRNGLGGQINSLAFA